MRKINLIYGVLAIASLFVAALFLLPSKTALAANPATVNFQGKVVNSNGTNVTDGTYSFVFRIYNTSSPTPTTACAGDATCLFEETQGSVTVTSGTFQVELGSTCTGGLVVSNTCTKSVAGGLNFGSNSGLYLTLQFNGDTSGSHGGFMWPVIHLTSVPYAYYADNAGALGGIAASGFIQNTTSPQSANINVQSAASGNIAALIAGASGQSVDILEVKANGVTNPLLSVGSTGSILAQNSTNSTTAFQVQNAAGSVAFSVDTTPLNTLLDNSNFENTNISSWAYSGASGGSTARVTSVTTTPYLGNASLAVTSGTTATSSDGVKYTVGTSIAANTSYTFSFYAKLASGTMTTLAIDYSPDGGSHTASCLSGKTVLTGGWTRYSCTLNSSTSVFPNTDPTSSAYFLIKNGDATTRTFYIDAAQLEAASSASAFKETSLSLNGVIGSPVAIQNTGNSTTAFQVLTAGGNKMVAIDTLNGTTNIITGGSASTVWGSNLVSGTTCSGTNWAGSGTGPYTHTAGSTATLSCTPPASVTSGTTYKLTFSVGGTVVTNEYVFGSVGGVNGSAVYINVNNRDEVLSTFNTGGIVFNPSSGFAGTVTVSSLQQITSTTTAALQVAGNMDVRGDGSSIYIGNTSGQYAAGGVANTAVGSTTLAKDTSGNSNSAFGYSSLGSNTSGSSNSAFGYNTLTQNISGSNNTAIGANSLVSSAVGSNNTAFGYYSLGNNTVGSNNTAIGYQAGYYDPNASFTFSTPNNLQNATMIGYGSVAQTSNSLILGGVGSTASSLIPNVGIGTTSPTNLFSISPNIYDTGTASVASGSASVTGSSTLWTSGVVQLPKAGMEFIFADGSKYTIQSVNSDTSITLTSNASPAESSAHYRVHNPAFYVSSSGSVQSRTSTNSTTAFQIQNSTGTSVLLADTTNQRLGVDVTYSPMSTPANLVAGSPTAGGSLTLNTPYYYKITAIDSAGGETAATSEVCQAIASSGTNQTIPLTWTALTGASAYRIYRSNGSSGTSCTSSGTEKFLTSTQASSYNDGGSFVPSAGTPPAANSAYLATNNSSNSLQLAIGGLGTPTGQLYVSGTTPINVSDKSTNGSVFFSGNPLDQFISGKYLYVVATKLYVIDVSSPSSPKDITNGGVTAGTFARGVYVSGKYAYVVDNTGNKLLIFDVSKPSAPVDVTGGGVSTALGPITVFVQGRYAYVGTNNGTASKLQIFDVSNPATPTPVSAISVGGSGISSRGVKVLGKYAYVISGSKLQVFDISNPANPNDITSGGVNLSSPSQSAYINGKYIFISTFGGSILAYDISNPASPSLVSTASPAATIATDVFIQGRFAYVADRFGAFETVDYSNPYSPNVLNNAVTTQSQIDSIVVQGRYAYTIGNSSNKLQIYDLGGTYSQQLEAGGTQTGTLQVDSNASIGGEVSIQGGLQVSQSLQTASNLGVSGSVNVLGGSVLAGGKNLLGSPSISTARAGCISGTGLTNASTYRYKVTGVDAYGAETTPSTESSVLTATCAIGFTDTISVTITALSGASAYKIYRTAANGAADSELYLVTTTSSGVYTDNGSISTTSGSAPPTIDTTGQLTVEGSLLLQQAVGLTAGQTQLSQIFTNASSNGGTVDGYKQTITVSPASSASTTNGIELALTDATTLANNNVGVTATVTDNGASGAKSNIAIKATAGGTNTSQTQYAIDAAANAGVAIRGVSTSAGGNVTCGSTVAALSIGVCGTSSLASSSGYGGYFAATGNGGTALFASNGTSTSNILQLQDGTSTVKNVLTVADEGAVTFANRTNSTAAFQVQNSTSGALFTTDTTNMRVGVNVTYAAINSPTNPSATTAAQNATPTVTPTGGTGSTSYNYIVIAVTATGNSSASVAGTTSTGVATLSSTTYNALSWTSFTGATKYNVYRTLGGTSTGFIGSTLTNSFNDTGITPTVGVVPTAGGSLIANSTYMYKVSAVDAAGGETGLTSEVSATTGTSANTTQTIDLTWTAPSPSTGVTGYRIYRTAANGASGTEKYLTAISNTYFTDDGSVSLSTTTSPVSSTLAYAATNTSNSTLQVSVGGNGTPTGQLYVSGIAPKQVGYILSAGVYGGPAAIQGSYAYYVNDTAHKLDVYDISNPASPAFIGRNSDSNIGTSFKGVAVQGKYAYVLGGSGFNKLIAYDISNPSNPTYVSQSTETFSGGSIILSGRYAYIFTTSILIFDISNPTNLKMVSYTRLNVAVSGKPFLLNGLLYIPDSTNNKLLIYNVSSPSAPVFVGQNSDSNLSGPRDTFVQGKYAYVASENNSKLVIYDVSNPANPQFRATNSDANLSAPWGLSVFGHYALLVNGATSGKVNLYDVSNPYAPVFVGQNSDGNLTNPRYLSVVGRYAYVDSGTSNNGLMIYDIGGIYSPAIEAGSAQVGTLQVGGNTQISGDLGLAGGIQAVGSISSAGGLGVYGSSSLQGSVVLGGGNSTLSPPSGVTVTPTCSSFCTGTFNYVVTAINSSGGETAPSQTATTTVGQSTVANNLVTWNSVSGAYAYKVYKTTDSAQANAVGLLTTTTSTSYTDTTSTGNGSLPPTVNTTSQLTVQGSVQAQNSTGTALLSIDPTQSNANNLVANSSFESTISNWSALNTGTANQSSAQAYEGTKSLLIATGTNASGGGASYSTGSTFLANGSTYTLSAYVKTDSNLPVNTLEIGHADNGTTPTLVPCLTTQSLPVNGGWQRFSCTWTSGSITGNPFIYFKQTDATNRNLYLDDILLQLDANADTSYRNAAINFTGAIVNGSVILQNAVNSSNALQVENASGNTIFNVDTTDTNLISNPGLEVNGTGWSGNGSATIVRSSSQSYLGAYSLKVTASANANNGAQFSLNPIVTSTSTTYTISWFAKLDGTSTAMTDMAALFSADGATTVACTPSDQTVVTTGWKRFSCSVASGVTTPSTSGFVRILQTGTNAGHIYYIDAVQMEAAASASAYGAGAITLNGVISSPVVFKAAAATTAFQIQNSSSISMVTADSVNNIIQIGSSTTDANAILFALDSYNNATDPTTTINGVMYYNTATSTFRCNQGGAWRNCLSGGPSNQSTATQAPAAGTDTYLTGSLIPLPAGGFRGPTGSGQDGSKITWRVVMSKTAAGLTASTFSIRVGTAGTTSDTLRCSAFSTGTATAAIDWATVTITVYATAGGSGTALNCSATLNHWDNTGGFTPSGTAGVQAFSTQASFDSTPAGTKIGLSFNGSSTSTITIQSVDVTTSNL